MILGTLGLKATDAVVDRDVSTYIPPKLLEQTTPIYPKSALDDGTEAWVYLHFMVDTKGKINDISVIDSIGGSEFETSAIAALRESRYAPAREDGEPVSASRAFKFKFVIGQPPRKETPEFTDLTISFMSHIVEENQYVLRAELAEMKKLAKTLNEFALLGFLESMYHQLWGTEESHLQALRRGLAYESTFSFLPDDNSEVDLLTVKFLLEAQQQYYSDALSTYRKLERLKPTLDKTVKEYHAKVLDIRQNRTPFIKTAELDEVGRWNYALLWNQFYLELESPLAKELRVRCKRESVTFKYEPYRQYLLPDSSGNCRLFVEGTPYASIKLHQL